MKLGIISGSHRNPSQSEKVAKYIRDRLDAIDIKTWLYSLADNPLPLWEEAIWEQDDVWMKRLEPVKNELRDCDGFVIISPEWHGQVPSGLKNFFLLFSNKELGHKPALLVSVSAGDGGAYPIAELRMSSYKNNRICYIPEQLIIRNVECVLNEDLEDNELTAQSYYQGRIDWVLGILRNYAAALKEVRNDAEIFHEKFKNGM